MTQETTVPAQEDGTALNAWLNRTVVALGALAVLLALFWGARELIRHETKLAVRNSIGVVDVEQAVAEQRADYLRIMGRADASDRVKEEATAFVKASTQRINAALGVVSDECGCVLLIKPAVLQHQKLGLIDHTPRLMDLLRAGADGKPGPTAQEVK